jgi:hypothetical protein
MRWWLQTDHGKFSVDNAVVSGLDFSSLDPAIWMVQWTDGKGEIEHQIDQNTNDNGLREGFIDIAPYVPFFQQFLSKCPYLKLTQAKKVDIDLIGQIFESKRQLPFHYPVASGDYWWDASDASMFSAMVPTLQSTTASLNNVITQLNRIVAGFNNADSQIGTGTNNAIASLNASGNGLAANINATVVDYSNYAFNVIDSLFTAVDGNGNALVGYVNGTLVGTMNGSLKTGSFNVGEGVFNAAMPGIAQAGVTSSSVVFSDTGQPYRPAYVPAGFGAAGLSWTAVSWTNIAPVAVTSTLWIPIGSTASVPVTPTEAAAIIQGIAARTNSLMLVKKSKVAEVNALTTVSAVISYDVLAGWPVIPLPPGYVQEAPTSAASSATIVGTPVSGGGGGGIPEAPNDGVTYGRHNMSWNPALAKTGDVLDGGSF